MSKTKWTLDPTHSEVTFKVKHMMITNVTGLLTDYTIDATSDTDDFINADVNFSGKLASINKAMSSAMLTFVLQIFLTLKKTMR